MILPRCPVTLPNQPAGGREEVSPIHAGFRASNLYNPTMSGFKNDLPSNILRTGVDCEIVLVVDDFDRHCLSPK